MRKQRKIGRTELQQARNPRLLELNYWVVVGIKKIVDEAMTPEVRRAFPEAEIVAEILKNPAVGDAGKAEVVEAVRERVRFNLQTRWLGR